MLIVKSQNKLNDNQVIVVCTVKHLKYLHEQTKLRKECSSLPSCELLEPLTNVCDKPAKSKSLPG